MRVSKARHHFQFSLSSYLQLKVGALSRWEPSAFCGSCHCACWLPCLLAAMLPNLDGDGLFSLWDCKHK